MVRIVNRAGVARKPGGVIVVTGHQAEQVEKALQGLKVRSCAIGFRGGPRSSVKAGVAAGPEVNADGAVICLAICR